MAKPWIRRIGGIVVIAGVAITTALLVTTPEVRAAFARITETRLSLLVVVITVETALLLLAAIWWLWWQLPKRQARKLDIADPKDRVDVEDDFRKTIGQALGGAAVLIGAAFAYLQFADQQQATHAQLQASHDLLISNQVSKGFEQLASDKIAERLGGIYALEGVMNPSPEYHQPVLEALCAFVREGTTRQEAGFMALYHAFLAADSSAARKSDGPPPNDIQAALTVIGRRQTGSGSVDLTGAHIPGAELNNADLRGAHLSSADLRYAHLVSTDLSAYADLRYADLHDADLSGANLNDADLSGANLSGADLSRAELSGAHLGGANLSSEGLRYTSHLTQEQLDQACGKPKALPPSLTLDKPCPPRPEAR